VSTFFSSGGSSSSEGSNYILNPNAESNIAGWNLYNNSGRTVPASVIVSDITYTAVAAGGAGNGINVEYVFNNTQPASTPLVTVLSPTHITVAWYNGPTLANNPTATQLAAAWNGNAGAVALATVAITGTSTNLQYITGSHLLVGGGDTSPADGTGGVATGVTLTRNTVLPLVGDADFLLSKDGVSREGEGVSTDFEINNADKGKTIQISFVYDGSAGIVLGSASDIQIFIYDITNAVLIPIVPLRTLKGPTSTILTFLGTFTASATSLLYRLIFHISTPNTAAWSFSFDSVVATDVLTPGAVVSAPALVASDQPVSGGVTDHMCVMWQDGATQWVPATIAGAALPVFGDDQTQLGFATNIVAGRADIYTAGTMDGFSFGPFVGYEQYIDNTAGGISPLPAPFTDLYVIVGMAISSTVLNIGFVRHVDLISNSSGVPLKGGLLSSSAVNDGTGDLVLSVGANGNVLVANSPSTLGLEWAPAVVASAPFTYTLATRTLTAATATNSVAGFLSAADHTTFSSQVNVTIGTANGLSIAAGQILSLAAATNSVPGALTAADHTTYSGYAAQIALLAPLASPVFTGTPSLPTGTTGVTQTAGNSTTALATTAFVTTANNLKANLASPTFTGTPSLPTGTIGVTQTAGNSTTALATTAFVTTADNLKAPLASPVFTGDVNVSTGNLLISTIGKGLQIKTGANSKIGSVTLVGGTATVSNTSVTANSLIFLTEQTTGGTVGFTRISAKVVGTSFTITSSNPLDTSVIAWMIVETIP
jgi:hypothetical protein